MRFRRGTPRPSEALISPQREVSEYFEMFPELDFDTSNLGSGVDEYRVQKFGIVWTISVLFSSLRCPLPNTQVQFRTATSADRDRQGGYPPYFERLRIAMRMVDCLRLRTRWILLVQSLRPKSAGAR